MSQLFTKSFISRIIILHYMFVSWQVWKYLCLSIHCDPRAAKIAPEQSTETNQCCSSARSNLSSIYCVLQLKLWDVGRLPHVNSPIQVFLYIYMDCNEMMDNNKSLRSHVLYINTAELPVELLSFTYFSFVTWQNGFDIVTQKWPIKTTFQLVVTPRTFLDYNLSLRE